MPHTEIKRAHFIGIGGSGMSGIALVAHERGIQVTGSDLKQSRYMRSLLRAGVAVSLGHDASFMDDADIDLVVISSAIPENNPELMAARKRGLEIWPRAKMVAYLGEGRTTLAVAGTHGKTTTSAMLATTLDRLGADPGFLIGGVVDGYDSTAKAGQGEFFVVEADESDGSFTWLNPQLAIVTNIEADHLDHYEGIGEIIEGFKAFLTKMPPEGKLIVWNETKGLQELLDVHNNDACIYGMHGTHDVHDASTSASTSISMGASMGTSMGTSTLGTGADLDIYCEPKSVNEFDVVFADGERYSLKLPSSPGLHNMLNATAVMAVLEHLRFDRAQSAAALSEYSGVKRRFDFIGEQQGITVVDDYAHHPTELAATIEAASALAYKRVHVLFQPHRYTRTLALLDDFAQAFDHADTITFMDIFSAGETPIPGITGEALVEAVLAHNPQAKVRFIKRRANLPRAMAAVAQEGDLIITMGAGDVTVMAPLILEALSLQIDENRAPLPGQLVIEALDEPESDEPESDEADNQGMHDKTSLSDFGEPFDTLSTPGTGELPDVSV